MSCLQIVLLLRTDLILLTDLIRVIEAVEAAALIALIRPTSRTSRMFPLLQAATTETPQQEPDHPVREAITAIRLA